MCNTILIVDDETIVTDTLSMLIRISLGDRVITYNDPCQALSDDLLKKHGVDLVISDFLMPGMNGLEFLKGVKSITPDTVAILLTGYADKENAIQSINEIGLYHYVEKPWDNNELIKTIQNGLEKKSLSDQLHEKIVELNRTNAGLEQTVNRRTAAIRNLLDNAGQGFLSFGPDLRIDKEVSRPCRIMFGGEVGGRFFPEALFPDDPEQREFVSKLIGKIFSETNPVQRDLYLSLLPEEVMINTRYAAVEYKMIPDSADDWDEVMMVILTDLTDQRALEARMEAERNTLQVVAKVAADPSLFFQCVDDYRIFFDSRMADLIGSGKPSVQIGTDIMRNIHTFKGTFAHWGMDRLSRRLNDMEDAVAPYLQQPSESITDWAGLLKDFPPVNWLEEEIEALRGVLGEEFFHRQELLEIEQYRIDQLKERIFQILPPHEYRALLPEVEKLRYTPFKKLLQAYPESTLQLAQDCEKLILPFEIGGGDFLVDSRKYGPFCRTLIHVFRNMVYHGIETPDERVAAGKIESGRIGCDIIQADEEIRIVMTDDGRGIDADLLRERLVTQGILTREAARALSDEALMGRIFADRVSTLATANAVAGRGVGLAAVKIELDKLGGSLTVLSSPDSGTRFEFRLPLKRTSPLPPAIIPTILRTLVRDVTAIITELIEKPLSVDAFPDDAPLDGMALSEYTGMIPLKGAVRGGLIVTAEKGLAQSLVRAMSHFEPDGDESNECCLDAVVECANILAGKVIHSIPEIETLSMDNPLKLHSAQAVFHYPGFVVRGLNVRCAAGNMTIYFMMESEGN